MKCNNNSINTKMKKGNRYTQDMIIDPREFLKKTTEVNYDDMQQNIMLPPQQTVQCNCECNNPSNPQQPICDVAYEPVGEEATYSSCSNISSCAGNTQCCAGIVSQPITPANSMPQIIQAYKVSDAIKFDRVATSTTAVLATSGTQAITTGITVTENPIPVGTFKLSITEVCFGNATITLTPGATTVAGNQLTATSVFTSNFNKLDRSGLNTVCSQACCKQNLGTTIDYSQAATTATIAAPAGADPENSINIVLKGTAGCSNVQIATTIDVTSSGIALTYDTLNASLCRAYNKNVNILDQFYQSKLSLSCIEATITNSNALENSYTVNILQPVYLQLLLRTNVSLLGYGLISVLGSIQPISVRDIPVVTADFNFEGCF